MTDARDDGDCVDVEAALEVDDWPDPDSRIPDQCDNRGTMIFFELSALRPGLGSRLRRLQGQLRERADPVPEETAGRPEYKPSLDAYLDMPMEDFKRAKAQAPEPYDWSSDGCTRAPDAPAGFPFRDACDRHDFAYRIYGHGRLRANPTDGQRATADARLKADLFATCDRERERNTCRGLAQAYYVFVRKEGGRAFYS